MLSKENKDNASAKDMVAPSGQKWRNNYGFYQSKKVFSIVSLGISSDMIDDVEKLWMKTSTSLGFQL